MVGRLFILVAIMVLGPLYIEVYLYHPAIVMEHDSIAIIPGIASTFALCTGFLLLAQDSRITAAFFALACAIAIAVAQASAKNAAVILESCASKRNPVHNANVLAMPGMMAMESCSITMAG